MMRHSLGQQAAINPLCFRTWLANLRRIGATELTIRSDKRDGMQDLKINRKLCMEPVERGQDGREDDH